MTNYHFIYLSTVSTWKLSRTPELTPEANVAISNIINSTQEFYVRTGETDDECFYLPDINEPVIISGQCETVQGMPQFDMDLVRNSTLLSIKLGEFLREYIFFSYYCSTEN